MRVCKVLLVSMQALQTYNSSWTILVACPDLSGKVGGKVVNLCGLMVFTLARNIRDMGLIHILGPIFLGTYVVIDLYSNSFCWKTSILMLFRIIFY